jgi:serum/glucocorticoid-regulated kinase 2
MYQRILSDPLNFPHDISSEARNVMTGLLQRDPSRRLGANGGEEIKRHPFFAKYIDWKRWEALFALLLILFLNHVCGASLMARKIQPPFKPSVVCFCLI